MNFTDINSIHWPRICLLISKDKLPCCFLFCSKFLARDDLHSNLSLASEVVKRVDTESDVLFVIYVFSKKHNVELANVFEIDAERLLRRFKNRLDINLEPLLGFVRFLKDNVFKKQNQRKLPPFYFPCSVWYRNLQS